MVQKTHKHRLTRRVFPCLFYLLNTSTELQHGTPLDEKHAFASLAMFDIQYVIKEWLDTFAILYPCIKHILKQSMKIVTVSVHRKWDRLVIYWHALVQQLWPLFILSEFCFRSISWERIDGIRPNFAYTLTLTRSRFVTCHFVSG